MNGFTNLFKPKPPTYDPFADTHDWSPGPTPGQTAEVQMAMGASFEKDGNTDQAIKVYQEVLTKNKHRADAQHRIAILYQKKGDLETACRYYEDAIINTPKDAEVHCDYGYCCYLRRDWKTAEASLRRAITLSPELSRAHNNLGLLMARTGRDNAAFAEFVKAGCAEPAARSNLAFALAMENHLPEAEKQYQLALAADPHFKAAQDGMATLQSLKAKVEFTADKPGTDAGLSPTPYLARRAPGQMQ
jgi:Tfp pilus assembly protein PilF